MKLILTAEVDHSALPVTPSRSGRRHGRTRPLPRRLAIVASVARSDQGRRHPPRAESKFRARSRHANEIRTDHQQPGRPRCRRRRMTRQAVRLGHRNADIVAGCHQEDRRAVPDKRTVHLPKAHIKSVGKHAVRCAPNCQRHGLWST